MLPGIHSDEREGDDLVKAYIALKVFSCILNSAI